jgi:hypothetical protein
MKYFKPEDLIYQVTDEKHKLFNPKIAVYEQLIKPYSPSSLLYEEGTLYLLNIFKDKLL